MLKEIRGKKTFIEKQRIVYNFLEAMQGKENGLK